MLLRKITQEIRAEGEVGQKVVDLQRNHVEVKGKGTPGRGNGKCKGPEAGLCLGILKGQPRGQCG